MTDETFRLMKEAEITQTRIRELMAKTKFEDAFSEEIWSSTYKDHQDIDVDDTFRRVATYVASVEETTELKVKWQKNFYDVLTNFAITAGGRIYSNAGTEWAQKGTGLLNCYVAPRKSKDIDSLDNILNSVKDQSNTLKSEGGWGENFSYIRPRGGFIHGVGVETPGAVKYMEIFDKTSDVITSGSGRKSKNKKAKGKIRKGAMMGVLDVWHPDIFEFITAKQNAGRLTKFNMSVNCTNEFMARVIEIEDNGCEDGDPIDVWDLKFPDTTFENYKEEWDGDLELWEEKGYPTILYDTVSVKHLWNIIMESTYNRAEPGILWCDRANEFNPAYYIEKIRATNPCLHPDSIIETINGRMKIKDIKEPTKVYTMMDDGSLGIKNCSASFISKNDAKTINIKTQNGKILRVTPNHKIKIHNETSTLWVEAQDLKLGDRIVQLCRARRGVAYSGVKLTTEDNRAYQMEHRLIANSVYSLNETDDVHHINGQTYDNYIDNFEVLSHEDHSRYTALNDNPQDHQEINELGQFISTGKSTKTVIPMPDELRSNNKNQYANTICSISDGDIVDVYDLTVEDTHNFIADFSVVHNCGEQFLAESGVCDLSSYNLTQFIVKDPNNGYIFDFEKFKKYIPIGVRFLDNVNTVSNSPLPEYKDSMINKRRIGLGILGWGSMLFMLKIRFGSTDANALRDKIMETLATCAYESSIDLAIEKGMFAYCDPIKHAEGKFVQNLHLTPEYMDKLRTTGIRNSSLLSCQPTGNTSIFANIVSGGIEPIFMTEYIRTVIVNDMPDEIADVCPKWYEGEFVETSLFKFTKEGDEEILRGEFNGTVYKIDKNRGLTKEVLCEDYGVRWLKARGEYDPTADYIVTTTELTADDHLNDLKGFARWVDSALSKTINLPNNYSFDDFKNVYLDTFKTGYIKGITTYRAGTMTTVLSSVDKVEDEEIILDDVKMPISAPASIKTIKAEGKKWYLTIVYHLDSEIPFALFVKTNSVEKTVNANNAVEVLTNLAYKKGIPDQHIETTISKIGGDTNASKITRIISLMLRHGVLIKNIVLALDTIEDVFVGSFLFQIKKFLASYVKDGEKVEGAKCENCGSDKIEFSEGCFKCVECGSSKCG